MHRSGTTLITKYLQAAGLFVGWDRDHNEESWFFLRRNEVLLKKLGFQWSDIASLMEIMTLVKKNNNLSKKIVTDINSLPIINFFGPQNYFLSKYINSFPKQWGWKDPRNTLLLPFWIKIFPNALILHIVRNGIDVAKSLMVREKVRRDKTQKIKLMMKRNVKNGSLINNKVRYIIRMIDKIYVERKYGVDSNIYIPKEMTLESGFQLWIRYLKQANSIKKYISNRVLEIRYEDFLVNPNIVGNQILDFIGLNKGNKRLKLFEQKIDSSRAFAFKDDPNLFTFYQGKKKHPLMQQYGYSGIS